MEDQVRFNLFPNKPWLCVFSTSLLKTLWKKEKLPVTSNFSISHGLFHGRSLSKTVGEILIRRKTWSKGGLFALYGFKEILQYSSGQMFRNGFTELLLW